MVEIGHKDTGFPIETLGPSHDTSTCKAFKGKGCMVEMGHKQTGFPIETIA